MDGAAPGLETAIPEAFAATERAFSGYSPRIIDPIKKPVKVSPAAVVSTTETLKIPCFKTLS